MLRLFVKKFQGSGCNPTPDYSAHNSLKGETFCGNMWIYRQKPGKYKSA